MAIIELKEFVEKIKSGRAEGRYIFAGEEDYLKRHYLSELSRAVAPDRALAAFNHIVYDGGEIDFAALTDAVKAPPMMSEYKLVEWRYADFSKMPERDIKALAALAEVQEEYSYTVLAIVASAGSFDFGTPKKKSKLLLELEKSFDILRLDRSGEKQLYSWLKRHFDAAGISVGETAEAVSLMVQKCGTSMDVLKGEVDKLCAYIKSQGRAALTAKDVERVCSSIPESDTFALSNAITERNRQKAFAAINEMKHRRVEPAVILSMARGTYSDLFDVAKLLEEGRSIKDIEGLLRMNQYKLKIYVAAMKRHTAERLAAALAALSHMDVASKNNGISGYTAVEIFFSEFI